VTSTAPPGEAPPDANADLTANEDDLLNRPTGTFAALRYRNLRLIWIGQTGHAAALWMEQIARPWLVLDLTDDNAVHLGGVVAMRVVPQLLFGVWAGVIADRVDRKTLLQSTKVGVFTLNVVFAAMLVFGMLELWHVYAAAFIRGIFMAFDQPARQSLIADSVPPRLVTNAVALMSSTQNLMRIVGVMMSGLLIGLIGLEGTFVTIAVVYFVSVVATQLIDVPRRKRNNSSGARGIVSDLMEGVRYAAQAPAVRGVLILSVIFYGAGMMWMQVFAPLFARTVMDTGAFGFSALVAAGGGGSLLGSLLIATRPPRRPGWQVAMSIAVMGAMLMLFAGSPSVPGIGGSIAPYVALFAVGIFHGAYIPLTHTILLTATPEHLRGRVISLVSLDRAMTTVGATVGGLLAAGIGAQGAQFAYGLFTLVTGFAVFTLARGLRDYRLR
jgi:MFS family permease